MAPIDDTNKSTIVGGESIFHQNVVDSNLPGISLTGQDTFNVCNNCVQGDSRSPFVRNFLISQSCINTKIGSRLSSTAPSSNKIFSK
jgi:hypothetical protein